MSIDVLEFNVKASKGDSFTILTKSLPLIIQGNDFCSRPIQCHLQIMGGLTFVNPPKNHIAVPSPVEITFIKESIAINLL